jgi:hypothetical protein
MSSYNWDNMLSKLIKIPYFLR